MFKLMQSDIFSVKAKGNTPDGKPFSALVQFRLPSDQQLAAIEQGEMGDEATLRAYMEGWTEFRDATGEPIEYTDEHREQAVTTPYIRRAFAEAFIAGVYGLGGRRKN